MTNHQSPTCLIVTVKCVDFHVWTVSLSSLECLVAAACMCLSPHVSCCFMCCGVAGGTPSLPEPWVSATSPAATVCRERAEGSPWGAAMPQRPCLPPNVILPPTWAAPLQPPLPLTWALRSTQRGMKWVSWTWITCRVSTRDKIYMQCQFYSKNYAASCHTY